MIDPDASPAAFGWHMPAEWEPHAATWLAWPHNRRDWPGKMAPVAWAFAEFTRRIAVGEAVHIIVTDPAHEQRARRLLQRAHAPLDAVRFFHWPTDRGWTRDFGPIFLHRANPHPGGDELAIVDNHFNGWAKYPNHHLDARIARRAADDLGLDAFPAALPDGRPFTFEGGAVELNGCGTLITTEECLLDQQIQVRNPGADRAATETALQAALGVTEIIWLGRGITGDDTHGHVDDFCRFVGPQTVVLAREPNAADPNHAILAENRDRLASLRLRDGARLDIIDLPMPEPLLFEGMRLPASYANFYIANAAVLVPTFNDPNDRRALGILAEVFTDRPVIGIHAVDLVWGLGTLHCLSQQQPVGRIPNPGAAR